MYTKTELKLLKNNLLAHIRHNLAFTDTESKLQFKPGSYVPSYHINTNSLVILEEKSIVEIDRYKKVISINFHDRYDTLIRFIMVSLEVELHRFGSTWIGYPNPEPLTLYNNDDLLVKLQGIVLNATPRTASIIGSGNITGYGNITGSGSTSFASTSTWNPTIVGNNTTIVGTEYTYPRNYILDFINVTNYPRSNSNLYTNDNRPKPKDKRLAAAMASGITQREMETRKRNGRL
jgi:hypothetical protein